MCGEGERQQRGGDEQDLGEDGRLQRGTGEAQSRDAGGARGGRRVCGKVGLGEVCVDCADTGEMQDEQEAKRTDAGGRAVELAEVIQTERTGRSASQEEEGVVATASGREGQNMQLVNEIQEQQQLTGEARGRQSHTVADGSGSEEVMIGWEFGVEVCIFLVPFDVERTDAVGEGLAGGRQEQSKHQLE